MLKMIDLKEQLPSIKQLKNAIPSHCFDRSTLRSLLYPVRDALLLAAVGYIAAILTKFEFSFINMLIWAAYACIQGTIAFGIFIVSHQCGHNAFSKHQIVNDIVGYIYRTSLLVPYFSWQRSHYVHHSKNNHLLDNQSHQPSLIQKSIKQYQTIYQMFGYYGFAVIYLMVHSVVGWLIYLFFHWTGSRRNPFTKEQYKNIPNHFNPFSTNQLFSPDMRFKVLLSTIGIIGMLIGLLYLGFLYGFEKIVLLYFGKINNFISNLRRTPNLPCPPIFRINSKQVEPLFDKYQHFLQQKIFMFFGENLLLIFPQKLKSQQWGNQLALE